MTYAPPKESERAVTEAVTKAVSNSQREGAAESFHAGKKQFPPLNGMETKSNPKSTIWGNTEANRDKGTDLHFSSLNKKLLTEGRELDTRRVKSK